jgi:acyl-CoA synthetase (AMP-forming)/AMP-acid ligase II
MYDSDPRTAPARSAHNQNPESLVFAANSWAELQRAQTNLRGSEVWMVYIDGSSEITITYQQMFEYTQQCISALQTHGVGEGSRVSLASHNHPLSIITYFACWSMGACVVPLNMTEDDQRLWYIQSNCGAVLTVALPVYSARVQGAIPVLELPENLLELFAALASYQQPQPVEHTNHMFHECLVVYTSGTTGNPKGVVLIQQNLFANATSIIEWFGLTSASRMMCVLPVHHVNGCIVTHVTPFVAGASVVLHRKFSVSNFFPSSARWKVHVISVVPTLLAMLCNSNADSSLAVEAGLKHVLCGAGPLTCELVHRATSQLGIHVVHGYGLSETTCYTCFLPPHLTRQQEQHWYQSCGFPSIGCALPCNEMDIHLPDGTPASAHERGEIVCRGSNVMKGYDHNKQANDDAFTYGWFRSGDEGFFTVGDDGNRYYFITGRLKELIIRGGVNLAPLEIDEVINSAPGVIAGICVGFEHTIYGEEVGALVVPEAGATKESMMQYCQSALPHAKCPKVIVFVESLPVTSTGKYQRMSVRHLFSEYSSV